jgi:hypothetical protein
MSEDEKIAVLTGINEKADPEILEKGVQRDTLLSVSAIKNNSTKQRCGWL